jgi:hypothetical protein
MKKGKQTIECPSCGAKIQITPELEQKFKAQISTETDLKILEKDMIINDLHSQINEISRKLRIGSQQRQGEALENEIGKYLRSVSEFKLDTINDVPKGVRGADIIQLINTPKKSNCGSILYEAKNTKTFSNSFIEKLKEDQKDKNATFAVLVTETLPKGVEKVAQIEGIWVCNLENFKTVCFVLREAAIQLSEVALSLEGKESKMERLYNYLISAEFKSQIEAIVAGFSQLDSDLASERRSMELTWKRREKIIQSVLKNTIHFYSNIKLIAGSSIADIKALELPTPEIVG